MLKNTLTEYCKNELIPNPYDLCSNIIDSIISNLYKFPFIQIWENISRNLVNIYGILSDTRLISNEELTILKSKLLNESIQLNRLSLNNSLDNNTIYTVFSLYFNLNIGQLRMLHPIGRSKSLRLITPENIGSMT